MVATDAPAYLRTLAAMKFADLPSEATFLDVDGIAVVRLPDRSLVAFETGKGLDIESRGYPNASKAGWEGDLLSRDEFSLWLVTGYNRFDVRKWRKDLPQ
jgi:hypothetical protein